MAMTETPPPEDESATAERERLDDQCLALYRSGAQYREIARQLGISVGRAHASARRARLREDSLDPEKVRVDLYHSLDRPVLELLRIIGSQATPDDRKIRAATALVPLIDRRAKLVGADAPVVREIRVQTLTTEALDEEQQRIEAELRAAGIDVGQLPSANDIADYIEATAVTAAETEPIEVAWP